MSLSEFLVLLCFLIVLINIFNNRFVHMQSDIALVFFSTVISVIILLIDTVSKNTGIMEHITYSLGNFNFHDYLLDYMLCLMLFTGAGQINLKRFEKNIKAITLLSFLTTIISSIVFGAVFYGLSILMGFESNFAVCLLLGCIVSPTDPIAATGILNKMGLSKDVSSVIEGESLFNDGMGVALFVFVKGLVTGKSGGNFFMVMGREVIGAILVSIIISFIMVKLMELTENPFNHILIGISAVTSIYQICSKFGASGAIAAVVCGMYFANARHKKSEFYTRVDENRLYDDFFNVLDEILNSMLFVMIGLTILSAQLVNKLYVLIPVGLLAAIISRYVGVYGSTILMGRKNFPGGYTRNQFTSIMTWAALKGGLCLALAMETRDFLTNSQYLIILNTTYVIIFFTVIVQGLTVKKGYQFIESRRNKTIQ